MTWFVMALKKSFLYAGRSGRKEYWMFILWMSVIGLGLLGIDAVIGTYDEEEGWGLLSAVFFLAMLVPYFSITARRLHDIGRSGWNQLIFIIPLAGFIFWVIWMVTESEGFTNKYGRSPKFAASPPTGGAAPA